MKTDGISVLRSGEQLVIRVPVPLGHRWYMEAYQMSQSLRQKTGFVLNGHVTRQTRRDLREHFPNARFRYKRNTMMTISENDLAFLTLMAAHNSLND